MDELGLAAARGSMTRRAGTQPHVKHGERDRRVLRVGRHQFQQGLQPSTRLHCPGYLHRRLRHQLHQHCRSESTRNDQLHKLHSYRPRFRRPSRHARIHTICHTYEHQNRTAD